MGVHLQIPHHHIWKEEKRGNSRISGNCLNYFWWIRFNAVMWRYPSSRLAIATWVRSLTDLPAFWSNNWMKSCSERARYMLLQLMNSLKFYVRYHSDQIVNTMTYGWLIYPTFQLAFKLVIKHGFGGGIPRKIFILICYQFGWVPIREGSHNSTKIGVLLVYVMNNTGIRRFINIIL